MYLISRTVSKFYPFINVSIIVRLVCFFFFFYFSLLREGNGNFIIL